MWDDLNFQESIKELKKAGPSGHTLAHITPEEGLLLKAFGGSGEINPNTGLRSYKPSESAEDTSATNDALSSYGANTGTTGNLGSNESQTESTIGLNGNPIGGGYRGDDISTYGEYGYGDNSNRGGRGEGTQNYGNANNNVLLNNNNNNGDTERLARETAAKAAREKAEQERLARISAAKAELQEKLKTNFDALDLGDGEAAFNTAFADDLEEDYAAAQAGLDDAYLTSTNFADFNTPGQGLDEQQTGLTDYRDTELGNLATMASNYGTHATAAAEDWYGSNLNALNALDTEEGLANFNFSELDLTGFADPTSSYDPEFFKDYTKKYSDPDGVYFGDGEGPDNRQGAYTGDGNVIRNAIDPVTGLPRGTTIAKGPPPAPNMKPE